LLLIEIDLHAHLQRLEAGGHGVGDHLIERGAAGAAVEEVAELSHALGAGLERGGGEQVAHAAVVAVAARVAAPRAAK
jgi:hypothetical protein